jgi:fatty acid desaturase
MHVAVDSAVAFLAILVLGLIWSLSLGVIIAIALLTGICLAPWTRRTEVRQLADRARTDDALDPGEDATA